MMSLSLRRRSMFLPTSTWVPIRSKGNKHCHVIILVHTFRIAWYRMHLSDYWITADFPKGDMLCFADYVLLLMLTRLTHDILQGIRGGVIDALWRWWWWWSWLSLCLRF
jgi:hypothetical protein